MTTSRTTVFSSSVCPRRLREDVFWPQPTSVVNKKRFATKSIYHNSSVLFVSFNSSSFLRFTFRKHEYGSQQVGGERARGDCCVSLSKTGLLLPPKTTSFFKKCFWVGSVARSLKTFGDSIKWREQYMLFCGLLRHFSAWWRGRWKSDCRFLVFSRIKKKNEFMRGLLSFLCYYLVRNHTATIPPPSTPPPSLRQAIVFGGIGGGDWIIGLSS